MGFRTEKISEEIDEICYGDGGDTVTRKYRCPCGKGEIIEEHDNIPGFRDHGVWISCSECRKKYRLDTRLGVGYWQIEII